LFIPLVLGQQTAIAEQTLKTGRAGYAPGTMKRIGAADVKTECLRF